MSTIYVDIKFHYESDEEAKRGREEIARVFDSYSCWYDLLRKHNKVNAGFCFRMNSDDFLTEAQTKINNMFENFKKEFPTLWEKCVIMNIKVVGSKIDFHPKKKGDIL